MDRFALQVLTVVCVLLAGCGGASAPQGQEQTLTSEETENPEAKWTPETARTTTPSSDRVVVRGDSLPVDADRTFERVERLMGTNGTPPTVRVTEVDGRPADAGFRSGEFSELMGVNETFPELDDVAGGAREGWVLIRYTDRASPSEIEGILAHEFAHVLQPTDLRPTLRDHARPAYVRTTDARFARTSVVEGVAEYVADQYAKRYPDDARPHSAAYRANWTNLSVGLRAYRAPYYYGQRYVRFRVEAGADLDDIYANPPRTAEQVLHNRTPAEEPRRRLDVNATLPGSGWDLTTEDAKGELYVRHLLEGELSRERAKRAAAGWGNDRLFTYYNVTKVGHVWVTRWDDADEAAEFEAALAAFLGERYGGDGTPWSGENAAFGIERVRPDTVALVAGDPAFADEVSLTSDESAIRVRADRGPTTNVST